MIAVRKGNEKSIEGIDDLLRKDVKTTLAFPKAAAISRMARKLIGNEKWDAVWANCENQADTVTQIANNVKLGAADAAIVWDATAEQIPELEGISVPEFDAGPSSISIGVLTASKQPAQALHFARYLAARDKGLLRFKEFGYRPLDGDKWAEKPELSVYAGGLMNKAVEGTIKEFEQREGCTVLTKYAGCGELVADINGGDRPDMYFACDTTFMDKVQDLYLDPSDVSSTEMVIITKKGNAKGIKSLADLGREGMKMGLSDPTKSALGALTDELLDKNGLKERVRGNEVYTSAKAPELVAAVAVGEGAIDAAIVYRANTTAQADELDVIDIDDPQAKAVQPVAVGKETDFPRLAQRLKEAILSAKSKQRFDEGGFRWIAETGVEKPN